MYLRLKRKHKENDVQVGRSYEGFHYRIVKITCCLEGSGRVVRCWKVRPEGGISKVLTQMHSNNGQGLLPLPDLGPCMERFQVRYVPCSFLG